MKISLYILERSDNIPQVQASSDLLCYKTICEMKNPIKHRDEINGPVCCECGADGLTSVQLSAAHLQSNRGQSPQ